MKRLQKAFDAVLIGLFDALFFIMDVGDTRVGWFTLGMVFSVTLFILALLLQQLAAQHIMYIGG